LEHTHIFKECAPLYDEMSAYNEYQKNWYQKKWEQARPIGEYIDYIEKIKRLDFPICLKFGLEVCYSPEHESDIAQIKQLYSFDFLTGSIHFIDGWAFSHLRQRWEKKDYDIDKLYERYYALMLSLINSGLAINYGDRRLGMNLDMLECMVKCGVPVYTASDAHLPANVGLYIKEMDGLIRSAAVRAGGVQRSGGIAGLPYIG
jgi:histidinol-phosphatase (PHP family)